MKLRNVLTVTVAIALILSGFTVASAKGFPGMHRRHGMGFGMMGLKTFLELNLTKDQESQLLTIIDKYKNSQKESRDSLRVAQKNLFKLAHEEKFNEVELRKAFQKASSIREDLFISRAKMRAEMKTVLTPEQLEKLKKNRAERAGRLRDRLNARCQNHPE